MSDPSMKEQDIMSAVFEAVIKKNMKRNILKASGSRDVNGDENANVISNELRSSGSTCTLVDQGNTWIAELFSSYLADDVFDEALDDAFIPDISAIQNFVSGGGIADLEDISLEPFSPQVNTVSSSTHDGDLSSSSMTGILGPETPRNDLISSSCSPVQSLSAAQRLRQFYEYEELYRNDILILDADDDPLPFPP